MSLQYRKDIDGLRAFSVLSVLIYHLNNDWLTGGFVGVDVFFVISGFLITKIIVEKIEFKEFSFSDFYARRVLRIFPALFTMLFVSGFVAWLILPSLEYKSFFQDFKAAAGQFSNFRFSRNVEYMGVGIEASPLLNTWSLGVEEQFYLLWPLFIFGILKYFNQKILKYIMIFSGVASLILCQYFLYINNVNQAFYMFYSRAFEFIIGAIISLNLLPSIRSSFAKNMISIIGGTMLFASVILISKDMTFPGYLALAPSVGAGLVIYSSTGSGGIAIFNKFLSIRPLVFIGLISYSLYLWHWPMIAFTQIYTGKSISTSASVLIGVASIILAYFSYKYVEKPFRTRKKFELPKTKKDNLLVISKGVGVAFIFIILGQQFRVQQDKLGRDYDNEMFRSALTKKAAPYEYCFDSQEGTRIKNITNFMDCAFKNNRPEVLLLGDSHANYISSAIKYFAENNELSFDYISVPGNNIFISNKNKFYKGAEILNYLKDSAPKYIFIANRYNHGLIEDNTDYISLIKETIEIVKKEFPKTKVVFIGQPAKLKESPSICIDKNQVIPIYNILDIKKDCPRKIIAFKDQKRLDKLMKDIKAIVKKHSNAQYFDTKKYIKSLYDENGNLLYLDSDHVNFYAGEYLSKYISKEVLIENNIKKD